MLGFEPKTFRLNSNALPLSYKLILYQAAFTQAKRFVVLCFRAVSQWHYTVINVVALISDRAASTLVQKSKYSFVRPSILSVIFIGSNK